MFVTEQALSQDYIPNHQCFLFFFIFCFYSTYIISCGNIEHRVLVNDLFIIRRETCLFRRTNNTAEPEELIDQNVVQVHNHAKKKKRLIKFYNIECVRLDNN